MTPFSRRNLFRLVALTVGLLPIIIAEVGLRIAGVAADPDNPSLSAIDRDPLLDLHSLRPLFVKSADGTRMEIGPERMNYFCPASFPLEKTQQTFRVFALGGSTTQGQPYRTETAFPQWLALRLEAALPGQNIEVVNCGGISYASYRVAAILDEVLRHSPDLILMYTGHNEFLEARTYQRQRRVPRWLARPLGLVAQLRVARIAANAFTRQDTAAPGKTVIAGEVDALLDHADGMDAYVRDEQWVNAVQQHFEQTLESMVARCQQASVPLVLCVPASDLVNTPPFKSQPDPALPEATRLEVDSLSRLIVSESAERNARILAAESILKLDPQHAMANYLLGRWSYSSGKGDRALAINRLRAARDHDVCPLRATTRIEQIVRAQTGKHGVYVLDTPSLLDRRNSKNEAISDGVADPGWFVDHVHPTIDGHQEVAGAIYQAMTSSQVNPAEGANELYAVKVQEHLKTLGEAYYGRAKQRLDGVNRWSRRLLE